MKVWHGNRSLRSKLVPIEELHVHPRNPRIGRIDLIRESLRRFGQQRAGLALPDGTLVAGNHTFKAAAEEGWTHFAADRSDLDPEEAEAYLVADNRLADMGGYDLPRLHSLVAPRIDNLTGLGYTKPQVAALSLRLLAAPALDPQPDADPIDVKELVLVYSGAEYRQVYRWLKMIGRERGGTDALVDMAAIVRDLVKREAESL